jgi:hypothetical protein
MAKLTKTMQKEVAKAESSGFEPLPEGAYHAKLRDVDTTRSGAKGPYWSWEFEIVDEEYKGRRVWNNTSLSEKAHFKMKETYEAFGADLDVDTDELIGQVVKVVLTQRTIQEGTRKGEITNDIARLRKADDDVAEAAKAEAESKARVDEIF